MENSRSWKAFRIETDDYSVETIDSHQTWWRVIGTHRKDGSPNTRDRLLCLRMSGNVVLPVPFFAPEGQGETLREWARENNPALL
jgi:hypothetical protein